MKNTAVIPDELAKQLTDFAKEYNFFSQGDCVEAFATWIKNGDLLSFHFYLKPHSEDENLHLTCTTLANMDLNDVLILYQNTRKKVKLLEEKNRLFKAISELRDKPYS